MKLVTLSMGATVLLNEIFKSGWTSSPKEKIAAGRLTVKLEDLILTQPDPCVLAPNHPDFRSADFIAGKAIRDWKLKTATLELSPLQYQACASCIKFVCNKEGGADRHLAELQEQFGIVE